MKIKDCIAVEGFGGFFWDDQAAIKQGIERNGFTYYGEPITPGFYAVRQPSEAVTIVLILEDGQIAYGDCVSVQYSARAGRDPIFRSAVYKPYIDEVILPKIRGIELTSFRELAESFDKMLIDGKPIHRSIRYGVTQAFADAVAKARKITIAEVFCEEYGTKMIDSPVSIFSQTGDDWYDAVDKAILRKSEVFPHALINNMERMLKLKDYIIWSSKRVKELGGEEYRPDLHYDVYGMLGQYYDNDIEKMVDHLATWEEAAKPYQLIIEEPFDVGEKEKMRQLMVKLIELKNERGLSVIICADEWCNTYEEIKEFVDTKAAEMIQIKSPDLGGVNNIIEAILYCNENGVLSYLGGSCCETIRSAQITANIALATNPHQMLAKPGMGVDESFQLAKNEMFRNIALAKWRNK